MSARTAWARLNQGIRRAFPSAKSDALRHDVDALREQTTNELEQLSAVVAALQEQLDRWRDSCTNATDTLSERVGTIERTLHLDPPGNA